MMRIVNNNLKHSFRKKKNCECCGKVAFESLDAAHVFTRGAGWVDLRCNLLALLRWCHSEYESKPEGQKELLKLVAWREEVQAESIQEVVFFYRRLPDRLKKSQIEQRIMIELHGEARELAFRELEILPKRYLIKEAA